jgi:hypothetical protein
LTVHRFRVKDKEGIEDSKSSLKMLISPNNCQFGSKFWIRPDEADALLVNTHSKCNPGTIRDYASSETTLGKNVLFEAI